MPNANLDNIATQPASYLRYLVYLLGDDNKTTNDFISAMELHGFDIRRFNTCDSLTRFVAEHRPHAILIDHDAREGRRALDSNLAPEDGRPCPVVVIASDDDFHERLRAVRAGADGFFLKPIDIAALAGRVHDRVSRHEIQGYRVLAVDDDVLLSQFYEIVLNSAGIHVKTLNEPFAILDEIKRFRPDLILMDLHMPDCSGIELSKLIRQNDAYIDIPIVFLSSENDPECQDQAIEAGGESFLTKPIDPEKLMAAVSRRAERYRALRQSRYE